MIVLVYVEYNNYQLKVEIYKLVNVVIKMGDDIYVLVVGLNCVDVVIEVS